VSVRQVLLFLIVAGGIGIIVMRFAFGLPSRDDILPSEAVAASETTTLGRAVLRMAGDTGESGVLPITVGTEAFAARMALAQAAEATLDVQYAAWADDVTGLLLLDALRAAAERGVRVRLLLDDRGIDELDAVLAGLDALEAAEVRLFNPFTLRRPKALSYAFDFPRLNRRMRNTSFTVDGAASIVGGRNVGDGYFAGAGQGDYIDADVLVTGVAAADVSAMFDAYWNSASSWPVGLVLPPEPQGAAALAQLGESLRADPDAAVWIDAVEGLPLVTDLVAGTAALDMAEVTLIADDPVKALGRPRVANLLIDELAEVLAAEELGATARVDVVAADIVPGARGVELLSRLARQVVAVRVLTRSAAATEAFARHAAFAADRAALLAAGVAVFEVKPEEAPVARGVVDLLPGFGAIARTRVVAVDGAYAFIGSFDIGRRVWGLNTEMGLLIRSPVLAEAIHVAVDRATADAFAVVLTGDGAPGWRDPAAQDGDAVLTEEPGTTAIERFVAGVIGLLPDGWII
jgi:putative cardiolipin synthase